MTRNEFSRIVRNLGGTRLGLSDGKIGTDAEKVERVISALTKAMVDHKLTRKKPLTSDDATWPELVDAARKIVFIYEHYGWAVDKNLLALLWAALHTGSRTRRSGQRGESKMDIGALIETAWKAKYGKEIAEAKLSRTLNVSRQTVRRWRQRADYKPMQGIPVENEALLDDLESIVDGSKPITAVWTVSFGDDEQ